MTAAEQALTSFFIRVSRRDELELSPLRDEPAFSVTRNAWDFTLPALHLYLKHRYMVFRPLDYRQFRRLLFSCPINKSVAAEFAEIIVADNTGNTDRSVYTMLWKNPDSLEPVDGSGY